MKLSERLARLGTETAFEVLVRARALEAQGRNIVHLEIGEPDFDTPAHITDAAVAALKGGATHYGPSAGHPRAAPGHRRGRRPRAAASRSTPEMVVVTPGGKPIMFYVILALIDDGRRGALPEPRLPDLRVDDPLHRRRCRCRCGCCEEKALRARRRRARSA